MLAELGKVEMMKRVYWTTNNLRLLLLCVLVCIGISLNKNSGSDRSAGRYHVYDT